MTNTHHAIRTHAAGLDEIELEDQTVLDEDDVSVEELLEGGTLFSQADQSTAVQKLAVYDQAIKEYNDAHRTLLSKIQGDSDRTIGVEINFRRIVLPDYAIDTTPVLIVTEKPNRTNVHIQSLETAAGPPCYIGQHRGIRAQSLDVIQINGTTSRDLNTKRALWAVGSTGATVTIDIVEEFA